MSFLDIPKLNCHLSTTQISMFDENVQGKKVRFALVVTFSFLFLLGLVVRSSVISTLTTTDENPTQTNNNPGFVINPTTSTTVREKNSPKNTWEKRLNSFTSKVQKHIMRISQFHVHTAGTDLSTVVKMPIGKGWENDHLIYTDRFDSCLITFGEWLGPFALNWKNKKPNSKIIAIDGDPIAYSGLSRNLFGLPGVTVHHYCVSDAYKAVKMPATGAGAGSVGMGEFDIICVDIDDLLNSFQECFFKIDVDGYEYAIIDKLIANPPPMFSLSIHLEEPWLRVPKEGLVAKVELLKQKYSKCVRFVDHNSLDDDNYDVEPNFYEEVCSERK